MHNGDMHNQGTVMVHHSTTTVTHNGLPISTTLSGALDLGPMNIHPPPLHPCEGNTKVLKWMETTPPAALTLALFAHATRRHKQ